MSRQKVAVAAGVALLLAACGGGGGGGIPDTGPSNTALQLSGTAATGAALSGAAVDIKCAAGAASTTTASSGTYSVTISGGALPCMVEVRASVHGTTISLHSVVEAGGTSGAVANVTPITEMIVAHLTGAMPEDSFKGFHGDAITREQLAAAVTAIVNALRTAGVDLGTIDPLKGELVAGTSGGKGNAYDQLLDAMGAKLDDDAMKVVVNQIAAASLAKSDDGLRNAMQAVAGGNLAGCPMAVSGKYRSIDMFGGTDTHTVDFTALKLTTTGSTSAFTITPDASNACVFTAAGTRNGVPHEFKVAIGSGGVGTYRAHQGTTTDFDSIGYLFPVQPHPYSDFRGTWSTLQTDFNALEHIAGQATFGDDRKVATCTYNSAWSCVPDTGTQTAADIAEGGVQVNMSPDEAIRAYAYRAPGGATALFATTVPIGAIAISPKIIVAGKLAALTVPAVGTQTKAWDTSYNVNSSNGRVTGLVAAPGSTSFTITAANPAAGTATRRNDATGRLEELRFNTPLTGVRTRSAGTFNSLPFPELFQIPLTGMGVTLSINAAPFTLSGPGTFTYNIAVIRP